MAHRVLRRDSLRMVISEHLVQEVERLFADKSLVLVTDKLVPGFLHVLAQNFIVMIVQSHVVFLDILEEVFSTEDLRDLDELVVVVLALEEGLLLEYHASKHAAERPNVETVVVGLEIDKQLGTLEVARSDTDIVVMLRVVELGETPIDEAQSLVVVVDHNVVRLDVTVHDTLGVAVVESLEHFINIETDVVISERLVKRSEVKVASVNVFHDKSRCLGHGISDNIDQVDDVDTTAESLQNFDFSTNFRFFDGFQDLDDNALIVQRVNTFIDLGVFTATNLLDDFIVLLRAKLDFKLLVV